MLISTLKYLLGYYRKGKEAPNEGDESIVKKALEICGWKGGNNSSELQSIFSGLFEKGGRTKASYQSDGDVVEKISRILESIASMEGGFAADEHLLDICQQELSGFTLKECPHNDLSALGFIKTVAAVAEVLQEDSEADEFELIGADLSGLQSFLYGIISKYAAKNLKGRSFYLQLIIEDVLLETCAGLNLKPWQVVYSSGGGFYVLASTNSSNGSFISELVKRRNKALFESHGTDLYLAMAAKRVPFNTFQSGELGMHWKELSLQLGRAKSSRYSDILLESYDRLFEVDKGSVHDVDHITGREIRGKVVSRELKSGEGTKKISAETERQISLGKSLKSADYWITHKDGKGYQVPGSPYRHEFLNKKDFNPSLREGLIAFRSFGRNGPEGSRHYGYGGNKYPSKVEETAHEVVVTFDELAIGDSGEIERLGVLRMDVDNLGTAFIKGFSERKFSLGLYSELSLRLADFFTTEINEIIAQSELYRSKVFLLYSGGDDLFAIGQWSALLSLAEEIRTNFIDFMGGEYLTLSGGFSMVTPRFPILKAGELAGTAEDRAKKFERGGKLKNAIDVFGIPIGWEEYDELKAHRDRWTTWLEKGEDGINSSLLNKLLDYRALKESHPGSFKWQWNAAYNIARRRKDSNQEAIDFFKEVIFKGENNYRRLDLCCIGGRWADLLTRNKN